MKTSWSSILIIILSLLSKGISYPTITLLSANDNGCTFLYTNTDSLQVEHPADSIWIFKQGDMDYEELYRGIFQPRKAMKIALPSLSNPTISFNITSIFSRKFDNKLNITASPSVRVEAVELFRDIPTAVLIVNPLLIQGDNLGTVSKGIIEIRFNGKNRDLLPVENPGEKEILKTFFDNPGQAQKFRNRPQRKVRKTTQLPAGEWLRITIDRDAVYKIEISRILEKLGTESIATNRLALYTNITGGRSMSFYSESISSTPMVQVPLVTVDGGDGFLDNDDYIYFYAQGPSGFMETEENEIRYSQNPYSFDNYYWLVISQDASPLSPETISLPSDIAQGSIEEYEYIYHQEIDRINYIESGLFWYEEKLSGPASAKTVSVSIPDIVPDKDGQILFRIKGGFYEDASLTSHKIQLSINDASSSVYSGTFSNYSYIQPEITWDKNLIENGLNKFRFYYTCNKSEGAAYFDWFELHLFRYLKPISDYLNFWIEDLNGIYDVAIQNFSDQDGIILNVSDFRYYKLITPHTRLSDETIFSFNFTEGNREQFILCTPQSMKSVEQIDKITTPDWTSLRETSRQADYIIIAPSDFYSHAERLADYHTNKTPGDEKLNTVVVALEDIFRQFSGDVRDPHAIRMFLNYAYLYWQEPEPAYVLLFGDGTYDYRGIESTEGNLIPTYQIETSNSSIYLDDIHNRPVEWKYVSFGNSSALLHMAIGRLPVRTVNEAETIVNNIIDYCSSPEVGLWRTTISLVADDPNRPNQGETSHTDQSERLSRLFPESYIIKKLYLLEYPEVVDASSYGVSKPDATEAILKALEKGTVLINFFGHGSPTVWAQEYVLVKDRDLSSIRTHGRLPLWVAGTCDWARFDMLDKQSMGEAVCVQSIDAAIGSFAATRKSFGGENYNFISAVIKKYFQQGATSRVRLGTAVQAAYGGSTNDQKYILLADPALYLAIPYGKVSVNSLSGDTLPSLSRLNFSGEIDSSSTLPDLITSGKALCTIFDAPRLVTREYTIKTLQGTVTRSISYDMPGDRIYNGVLQVNNGAFQGSCIIPKDISFSDKHGEICATIWDENGLSGATGSYENIIFKGSEHVTDKNGPKIEPGFVNRTFRNGDKIPLDAKLLIRFSDPLGINLTGQIGHTIQLQFDGEEKFTYDFTEDFIYDQDSDTAGYIESHLPYLTPGLHELTVKAWDNANNPGESSIQFYIVSSSSPGLEDVYTFPNPFRRETSFTFNLNRSAEVLISVYTVRGRKIREIRCGILEPEYHRILFDGRDEWGERIARGVYLYKIRLKDIDSGESRTITGKMIKG